MDGSRCNEVYWWVIGTYMHHAWLTHKLSTTRALVTRSGKRYISAQNVILRYA